VAVGARVRAVRAPLLGGLGALAAAGLVAAVDPGTGGGIYPRCPFLALTGHPCPLCGGLRAVHALGHGEVAAALSLNLMVVVLVVLVAAEWARRVRGRLSDRPVRPLPGWSVLLVAGAFVLFGVVRNLPFGTSLAP
jgi:hypothetical protein